MGQAVTTLDHARHADESIGARILRWMREIYCGLHGHDRLLQFERERMFLQCVSCGHETPGWALSAARPVVRERGESRRRVLRPHLVGERRIA